MSVRARSTEHTKLSTTVLSQGTKVSALLTMHSRRGGPFYEPAASKKEEVKERVSPSENGTIAFFSPLLLFPGVGRFPSLPPSFPRCYYGT